MDETAPSTDRRRTELRWMPGALAGLLALLLAAVIGRDLWFFSDDWNILAEYHDGNLLQPFNGHLSAVPAGIYQLLFHTVGLGSYTPYRAVGLVALAILVAQVVRFASTRFATPPVAAVAGGLAAAAVMWNSAGQMNLLFPFLMNFSIPIAALLAIWWHLDRAQEVSAQPGASPVPHELLASLWLAVALATSGLGLMAMAAVGVELLAGRAPLRRWLVLAPGPVLWAVWYLTHRDANEISADLGAVLSYSARMFGGALVALGAGWRPVGLVLGVLMVGLLAVAALRWRSLDGRTLGALAAPLSFVAFTALTRVDNVPEIPPDELRYSWAVAAYLVLAVLVAVRHDPGLPPPVRVAAIAAVPLASAVLVAGLVPLTGDLREWNTRVADARPGLSTVLYATEAIGTERVDPDVVIPLSYVPVTTGGYLEAIASVGSPIASIEPGGLGGAELDRQVADRLLVEQLPVELVASDSPQPGDCPHTLDAELDGTIRVEPGSRVLLLGEGDVLLSRFAEHHTVALGQATGTTVLSVPDDAPTAASAEVPAAWPYRLSLPDGLEAAGCD